MSIRLRKDLVIVEKIPPTSTIVLPDEFRTDVKIGRVIAVGRDCADDMQVGDTIVFGEHIGEKITIDGGSLLAMRGDDVLAVMH